MIRQIKARPLFCMFVGLLLGINFPAHSWIFGVLAVIATTFRARLIGWLCAGLFMAGFAVQFAAIEPLPEGDFAGRVNLTGFAEYRNGQTWVPFRQGTLKLPGSVPVAAGELWRVQGRVTEAKSGVLKAESFVRERASLFSAIGAFRLQAIERINQLYGTRDGSWMNALTFNFASELERGDKDSLIRSGTYHLVSASGLHVWVLAIMSQSVLLLLSVRREVQLALVGILLVGYCMMTGFHAPTIRSSVMWLILSSAYLFRRSPDGISALSLCGILWLLVAPRDALSPSFQLSYVVTSALVIWFERGRASLDHGWRRGLGASCVATLAAEPLGAWWFGRIVLIGPIANLLIELGSSVLVVLGFLSLIPGLNTLIVFVAKPILWGVQSLVLLLGQSPGLILRPKAVPPALLVLYYLTVLALLWSRPHWGPARLRLSSEQAEA